MPQVNTKAVANKPAKPYPDFPLFPHASGRWAKKIRGQLRYFGPWADPDAALQLYLDQWDDLYAGRRPRTSQDGVAVRDLCNRFLTAKRMLADTGEITERTFADYKAVCTRIVDAFGRTRLIAVLGAEDFDELRSKLAKTRGPVALGNEIQRVRVVFKYAYDAGLVDRPVRFGPMFKRPSKKTLRRARHAKGPRMFEATAIRAIAEAAGPQLEAMVLLGINCGLGNQDVATLPKSALDLKSAWLDYPRPKTGVPRRCPLWPETVAALNRAAELRPEPADLHHSELVFVTKYGKPWSKATSDNPISNEMAKLVKAAAHKAASDPGDFETSFEQAFSSLAHSYLRDKAPDLLDHEIGFQLLERNEDNTRAVGIFGFKVGPSWLYSPVFFLNGDLKGHRFEVLMAPGQRRQDKSYVLRRDRPRAALRPSDGGSWPGDAANSDSGVTISTQRSHCLF